ncbi:hypothetical protein [Archangium sp.]
MTVTKQSPMNPEHLNDVDPGIDALSRNGLATTLDVLLGLKSLRGRPPGL